MLEHFSWNRSNKRRTIINANVLREFPGELHRQNSDFFSKTLNEFEHVKEVQARTGTLLTQAEIDILRSKGGESPNPHSRQQEESEEL